MTAVSNQPAQSSPLIRIRSAIFEILADSPSQSLRIVSRCVVVLLAILVVWALVARLDIVTVAQGRLVPETYVKIVQPAESGIIREILVEQGSLVQKGQVLVRMDSTVNGADRNAARRELQMSRLQLRRIESELSGRRLTRESADDSTLYLQTLAQHQARSQSHANLLAQELSSLERMQREHQAALEVRRKLEDTLPSYERSADAYARLASDRLVGTIQAEEKRREAIEKSQDLKTQNATVASLDSALVQQQRRIEQIRNAYASELNDQRIEIIAKISRLEQETEKLNYQNGLLELTAPQAGLVKDVATTTIGAVVQPGTVIVNLVPVDEPLLAEVMIDNQDVGFVREGQSVRLKVAAFPFQKYGTVAGIVKTLSADAENNDSRTHSQDSNKAALTYKALVILDLREFAMRANKTLTAGMLVSAEIIQDKRTVFEYLLSPVQRVVDEAGRER